METGRTVVHLPQVLPGGDPGQSAAAGCAVYRGLPRAQAGRRMGRPGVRSGHGCCPAACREAAGCLQGHTDCGHGRVCERQQGGLGTIVPLCPRHEDGVCDLRAPLVDVG